jgi:hypothetical protein
LARIAYLDITSPPIQVQMQILNCAIFAEHVLEILLGGFLVNVGDDDNPAFDGADGSCAGAGARVAGLEIGHGCGDSAGCGGLCYGVELMLRVVRAFEQLSPISQVD